MVTKQIENNLSTEEWSHLYHNLDEIKIGSSPSTTFIYYGSKEIKKLNTSCFCLSTQKIKYLDRVEIKVRWNVKPTPKINKQSKKTVDVIFDDEEVTLTLIGIIIP